MASIEFNDDDWSLIALALSNKAQTDKQWSEAAVIDQRLRLTFQHQAERCKKLADEIREKAGV